MSRLLYNLKRVYEDEQKGIYDHALLVEVSIRLRDKIESFLPRLRMARQDIQTVAENQFSLVDDPVSIAKSTEYLLHQLFLYNQLEASLTEAIQILQKALKGSPPEMMLAIDTVIDVMHLDFPLLTHISTLEKDPIVNWIVTRRNEKHRTNIEYMGLRGLFTRPSHAV